MPSEVQFLCQQFLLILALLLNVGNGWHYSIGLLFAVCTWALVFVGVASLMNIIPPKPRFKTPHKGQRRRLRRLLRPPKRKARFRKVKYKPPPHFRLQGSPFPGMTTYYSQSSALHRLYRYSKSLGQLFNPLVDCMKSYCAFACGHGSPPAVDRLSTAMRQSPAIFKASQLVSFIWDTGASFTVTPEKADFEGEIKPLPTPIHLNGLAKGLSVRGTGKVKWTVQLDNGDYKDIIVKAYYAPGSSARLLSPQSYIQQWHQDNPTPTSQPPTAEINADSFVFTWSDGASLTVPLSGASNLPVSSILDRKSLEENAQQVHLCVTDEANQNLSEAQKELLRWHFRLGHVNFASIQLLLRSGALASSEGVKNLHRAASKCPHPKCASCQYSKMKSRSAPGHQSVPDLSGGNLTKGDLFPGERVSVDHFISGAEGRLYESKGRTDKEKMYHGGCIFVDHATGFVHVEHQVKLTTHETLLSKHKFEEVARDAGVIIQKYQTDNGSQFTSGQYTTELSQFKQISRFAGVGAHHQNGIAERNIQTIMSMARTMMLHAAIHWPEATDTCLWPMAVDYAVFIHNHLPNRQTGLSPVDLFTRTRWPTHKCHDLQVWGCPTYVLDPRVHEGKKLPKWTPRSRRGQFMGLSKHHASTAPLVLNLDSLYISPQFHCVFDCWFSTVFGNQGDPPALHDPIWDKLFGESHFQYYFDDYLPPPLDEDWDRYSESVARSDSVRQAQDAHQGPPPPLAPPPAAQDQRETVPSAQTLPPPTVPVAAAPPVTVAPPVAAAPPTAARPIDGRRISFPEDVVSPPRPPTPSSTSADHDHPSPAATPLREPPPSILRPSVAVELPPAVAPAPTQAAPPRRSQRESKGRRQTLKYHEEFHFNGLTVQWPESPEEQAALAAFIASKSDPDVLTYDEAIRDSDVEEWKAAMNKEIMSLVELGTWEIIPKSAATGKIIPGTWVLRRKRKPDGTVKSLKARWCVRGDLQDPVDNTFAPVVQWSTIRMVLYFTLFFGLVTKSIDFSNAFVQATLHDPIFVHLPRGFSHENGDDVCLKLKKSLYGISQAPRLWFEHLRDKLLSRGFRQSQLDPCLFYSSDTLIVIYVDDVIIASKQEASINKLIESLKTDSSFTDDGELSSFLGIDVARDEANGTFTLKQAGLTERVISTLGLADGNPNYVPAIAEALGSDPDGPPMKETWDYRSVVGMLLYLSNNSRPDIAFAVHQCARFSHAPKQSHAAAVKTIGRYLLRTRDQGLILKPTGDLAIDCYVDADFAGLWKREDDQNPLCVKSRTGYLITLGGCPLTWTSKMQTEIAMSTMEAEYIALSHSMRELIPIRALVEEMASALKFRKAFEIRTHSKVFEDNNGALTLASCPRMTPRSKHIAVKYHFFRDHVTKGNIRIYKIDTKEQQADIFTKGLVRTVYETIRKLVMGW